MCKKDVLKALDVVAKKWKFHNIADTKIVEHKKYKKVGAPKKGDPQISYYQVKANTSQDQDSIDLELNRKSCFVLGTNMPSEELSAEEILKNYKA